MEWEVYKRSVGFVTGQFVTEKSAREFALHKNGGNPRTQVWIVRRKLTRCPECRA